MAVIGQIVVESRRYSGWIDRRYPIGYWQAALLVTGDATGGLLAVDLVFQGGVAAFLNSQMYSVERFAAETNNSTSRTVRISAVNMGGPTNLGYSHEYTVILLAQPNLAGAALAPSENNICPWFLGSQRTAGVTASLSMVAENVDGVSVKFEAEGYRWSPRSVLVDGGPQRPPTGLYRA